MRRRRPNKDEIKPGADLSRADLTRISYNNKTKYDKGSPLDIYIQQNK
jgi:hypothetical protein